MSQTVITKAFVEWKAQQAVDNKPVTLDEFIFAFIPDLDIEKPIDDTETTPPADKIVHRQAVSKSGVINGDSVVYSLTLGADVGDFDFNWIGLANKATGTVAMIIHAPTQRKIKNASGQQGNVLVRSMLMEYSGAEAATNITTPAETWQIDFTARLASMDERQRVENIDLYGAAAFFDTGYLVGKNNTQYFVTKGAGYVAGLRTELLANQNIAVSTKPVKVWLDVSWAGTLTSVWTVKSKITVAANLSSYVEGGVQHYVFALASIDANGNITDLRPVGGLDDQALKAHEKSRNHPDATTTEKGFTKLSSAVDSTSESLAATPKAVKAVNDELTKVKNSLGSAAGKDVTTQYDDTNGGRLMTLGCRGIGGSSGDILPGADVNTAAKYLQFLKQYGGGIYRPIWNSAVTNPDGLAKYSVNFFGNTGDTFGLISIDYNSGKAIVVGANQAGIDAGRVYVNELYGKLNKPTAADVDAVSATQGGTFQKPVIFNQGLNSRGRITWGDYSNAVGSSKYNAMVNVFDSTGKMRWAFGPYINEWSVYAYNSDGSYKGNIFRLDHSTFNANFGGMVTPANYSNFDARYILSDGAIYAGFVSGDAARPYLRHKVSNAVVVLAKAGDSYTKSESEARYQAKGNYTPAGQAYTKAESDTRYVQNIRLGAVESSNSWSEKSPYIVTGSDKVVGDDYIGHAVRRPLQKLINGTWINAGW